MSVARRWRNTVYNFEYGITLHYLELLLEYFKSLSYLPYSLQITLKTAIAHGLVYDIYQKCKHHGKLVTTQLILCVYPIKSMISYFC